MKKALYLICFILFAFTSFSQDYNIFETVVELANLNVQGVDNLQVNAAELKAAYEEQPDTFVLNVANVELLLVRKNERVEGVKIVNSLNIEQTVAIPNVYEGAVIGSRESFVAVTIGETTIEGTFTLEQTNYSFGYEIGVGHVIVNEQRIAAMSNRSIEVPTDTVLTVPGSTDQIPDLYEPTDSLDILEKLECRVVTDYFEVDYHMFTSNSSSFQLTTNKVVGMVNAMYSLYEAEQIKNKLVKIKIWDVPDGYPTNSSTTALNEFRLRNSNNFEANLKHLISTVPKNLGGVAYVNVACQPAYAVAYSNINNTYVEPNSYSWTIQVMTHERGHNLGSYHTQECVWTDETTGNLVRLSDCYAGNCTKAIVNAADNTIMSYDHLCKNIDFNKGFGYYPGNVIRNTVATGTCFNVEDCGDGGGGNKLPDLTKKAEVYTIEQDFSYINISLGVSNLGEDNSATTVVRYTLSEGENPVITYNLQLPAIPAKGYVTIKGKMNISTLPNGSYTLRYFIDPNNAIIESNENNNNFKYGSAIVIDKENGGGVYPANTAVNPTLERFDAIIFGSFVDTSDFKLGYVDRTDKIISVNAGQKYTMRIYPKYTQPFPETYRTWIDYDNNKIFSDDELVHDSGVLQIPVNNYVLTEITIPETAKGLVRLRTSMKYWHSGEPDKQKSYGTFTYGQVRDYSVNINNSGGGSGCAKFAINDVCIDYRQGNITVQFEPVVNKILEYRYKINGSYVEPQARKEYSFVIPAITSTFQFREKGCENWSKEYTY